MQSNERLLPHITVATIIEKNDNFLLVKEDSGGKKVYNQPAGHAEANETLIEAAIRETLEETCWQVEINHYLGVSQYKAPSNGITYIRHSFVAAPLYYNENVVRDSDIVDTVWMSYDEIIEVENQLRSPLVLNDIKKYRQAKFYDLKILEGFIS